MNEILGFLENQMDVPPHPIPIYKETKETETSGDPPPSPSSKSMR
jgi:hypothetical protein